MDSKTTKEFYDMKCVVGHLMSQVDEMQRAITELEKENKMLVELIERLGLRVRNLESMESHI